MFESISLPLRYRIAQLTGGEGVPRPGVADHPRTIARAKLIERGVETLPFHGFDTLESILKIFGEHGIDKNDPYYRAAYHQVESLNQSTPQLYRGLTKPGLILDELRAGGAMLIRAAILARAGVEDETTIKDAIDESLDIFSGLAGVAHRDDLVMRYKDKFIVRSGVFLPSYYHLVILAFTQSWRTPQTTARIGQAVTNLCLLALPHALMKFGSQLLRLPP